MNQIFSREIGNRKRIKCDELYDLKTTKIDFCSDIVSEVIITSKYIIFSINKLSQLSHIKIYNLFTCRLINTIYIPMLNSISYVSKLYYITLYDGQLFIYHYDIESSRSHAIFLNHSIIFPGFIEISKYHNNILIFDTKKYTLYDIDHNIIEEFDSSYIDDIEIYNSTLKITKKNHYLGKINRCCAKTINGNRCKKRSKYKYCPIHYKESIVIYDIPTNKPIRKIKQRFNETDIIINEINEYCNFYILINNTFICHDLITGIDHTLPYSGGNLVYINAKLFGIIDTETIIYDYNYNKRFTIDNIISGIYCIPDNNYLILVRSINDLNQIIKIDLSTFMYSIIKTTPYNINTIESNYSTLAILYNTSVDILHH